MAQLEIHLLGPFQVTWGGKPVSGFESDKARALLAYLSVEADRPHRREALAGLLWPDTPEKRARTNLRSALANVRRVIGDHQAEPLFLITTRQTIQFDRESDAWLDVTRFSSLAHGDESDRTVRDLLEEAAALYQGPFLEGFSVDDSVPFEEWAFSMREELARQALDVLDRLSGYYEQRRVYERALHFARQQVKLAPWREAGHQQVMRLLALSGQPDAAVMQYETCRRTLAEELSVEPSQETKRLLDRIRAGKLASAVAEQHDLVVRGYELGERIGEGSYGSVFRAYQPLVGREVAIKVILPKYANRPDFIRRFEAEAQIVARLEHPYIVPLYDFWRDPAGAYLVMRWLRGGSLQASLSHSGPWDLELAASMVDHISAALSVAHHQGLVHRDIKPANILLDKDNNAYLSDFGIAKEITLPGVRPEPGSVTSSPAYVSPEQVQGGPISPQADIYSLGVVLYELLTGRHPFAGESLTGLMSKHLHHSLPLAQTLRPELPPAVDQVIQRATVKEPADRFPSVPAMAAAFRQALTGDTIAPLHLASVPRPNLINPYKGLRPFQEADAADFFGRDALVEQLLDQLGDQERFLAVLGPSGSGKSSVVRAGLVPALRRGSLPNSENWFVVQMLPGAHPLEELEIALLSIAVDPPDTLLHQMRGDEHGLAQAIQRCLPSDDSELVLVIDQFEELFTLVEDEAARVHFLSCLAAAVSDDSSRLRLIITLRADFYDRPLVYRRFGELVRKHMETVMPLSSQELQRAILGPAERVGAGVEAGLLTTIINDVSEQPGALPLLQYALTELFEQSKGHRLTREAYQAIGGVSGALARRAEELYSGLDAANRDLTRKIFLRLVSLGEAGETTRRRVLCPTLTSAVEDSEAADKVLDIFGQHRLLTFDCDVETRIPTVELAHESLLRAWERLREWVEDSRDDVRTHQSLSAAAAEWIDADQNPDFLLRGTRLAQLQSWVASTDLALDQVERDFLNSSLVERQARQAAENIRQLKEKSLERRSRNFLRALVGILAIATVIALGLSLFAFKQRREALEAYSLSLAASAQQALDAKDTASALVLALAANRIDQPPEESQRTLIEAAFAPGPRRRFEVTGIAEGALGPALSLAISPDGRTALAGLEDGSVILWNFRGPQPVEIHRLTGHTAGVNDVAFSPDGKTALSGSTDRTLILWDITTGREIHRLSGHSGAVRVVAIRPGGRMAISGGLSSDSAADPGELILWDLETGREMRRFEEHSAGMVDVAFSPDGRAVLASSGETDHFIETGETPEYNLTLWEVETGEIIRQFEGIDHDTTAITISPDGATAVTGSWDRNLYLLDLKTGEQIRTFEGHTDPVTTLALSPGGRRALSGSWDNSLILWDLETGEQILQFKVHNSDVLDVTLSPDGRAALSTSRDGTLILWDLVDGGEINRFEGHTAMVFDVTFTPDGKRFLSASGSADPSAVTKDTSIRLWDLETGHEIRRFEGHADAALQVAISPDGRAALSASNDTSVRLWDLETGAEIRRFEGHTAPVTGIAYNPDGYTGLSCSIDGTLFLWDLETGKAIHHLTGHTQGIWSVAISPDGRTALSGADDSNLILWDLETGEEIRRFLGHDRADEAAVSGLAYLPDGRTAISGGTDGYLIHWDLETGREIRRFGGHSGIRTRVSVSPDGRIAFSSGWDGALMLWDLERGEMIRRFKDPQTGFVFDSTMSPDGRTGLVGSSAQTIIQWQLATLSLDKLHAWVAANRYVRDLSCEERDMYRIEPLCGE